MLLQAQNTGTCTCRDYLRTGLRPADTVIQVTPAFRVAICGFRQQQEGKVYFSEFTLYDCAGRGQGFIQEWDATRTCLIHPEDSSLVVEELVTLPQGPDLELRSVPCWRWAIDRTESAFDGGVNLLVQKQLIAQLPLPNVDQVEQFEQQLRSTPYPDEHLLGYLSLCAAHDLNGWRERFEHLQDTGRLDGAVEGYYTELRAVLEELPRRRE
ncbi:MAG: hypothetical protein QM724_14115 [Flavobacteriales bacterium]